VERVGFIGVGLMGGGIAARMMEKGIPVIAYDKSPDVLARMRDKGADVAASVRDVVDEAEIVFACLPDAKVSTAVALGPDGVASGKKVRIYVENSTLGGAAAIALSDALAQKDIAFLDTPVVGGTVALEVGTLGVLCSGPKPAFERTKFALDAFAGKLFYLGEKPGAAQAAKVMNNAVAYAAFLATCEAVAMGLKAGLDIETAVAIINQGSGANFFSQRVFPDYIVKGKFEGTGAIEIGVKDVKLFLEEAKRLQMPTPMATETSALQVKVAEAGTPGRDTMTVFHYFCDLAGITYTAK
jgi:3-hydroxyisobutyrate dehydrogenase-like beta-hydroxyacid dehydrogenase